MRSNAAGGGSISLHAYGAAIDINPVQNPYIKRFGARLAVSPRAGRGYLDRKNRKEGMAEPVVELFAEHGFSIWGGCWRNPTDYQHFQISRRLAQELARLSAKDAKARFEQHVRRKLRPPLAALEQKLRRPKRFTERHNLATIDLQGDALQRLDGAVGDLEVGDVQKHEMRHEGTKRRRDHEDGKAGS